MSLHETSKVSNSSSWIFLFLDRISSISIIAYFSLLLYLYKKYLKIGAGCFIIWSFFEKVVSFSFEILDLTISWWHCCLLRRRLRLCCIRTCGCCACPSSWCEVFSLYLFKLFHRNWLTALFIELNWSWFMFFIMFALFLIICGSICGIPYNVK